MVSANDEHLPRGALGSVDGCRQVIGSGIRGQPSHRVAMGGEGSGSGASNLEGGGRDRANWSCSEGPH